MTPRLSPTQETELRELITKTLIVFDFLAEENRLFPGAEVFRDDLERAAVDKNLRGMRMAWRDMVGWTQDLPIESRVRLDATLRVAGRNLSEEKAVIRNRIREIRKRGLIGDQDEYREVLEYVADFEDCGAGDEFVALRRLLKDFETRLNDRPA